MSQATVYGIRLDGVLEKRFLDAVAASESKKIAEVHRDLLRIALKAVESEGYDFDRALVRVMAGLPAEAVLHHPLASIPDPPKEKHRKKA
jgi:hypothetical protein